LSQKRNRIKIEVPSEVAHIRIVSDKILNSLKDYNLNEDELLDIKLCIEEALRNAMEHGNKSKKNLPVKISYCVNKDKLEVTVEDVGRGFDYRKLPDPTKDENIMKGGGRGVFLILRLMDEVIFSDKGNRITMVKKINHGGSA